MESENGASEQEKQELMELFRAKMQKVRAAQPGDAEIQALKDATERLLEVAERDTGQSRRCANFLLAWWNAEECGGFDLTDMWKVDLELAQDMVTVFSVVSNWQHYPDGPNLALGARFEKLAIAWRRDKEAYWSGQTR